MIASGTDRVPAVSVIVVNWNGKALLGECLASLARQSFADFETILVDNGSQDGSLELVRERYPSVRLVALPANVGFARANNLGLAQAYGRYIALLNNDAEADAQWLAELVTALETHQGIGFCASRVLVRDQPDLADACGDSYAVEGVPGKIGHLQSASALGEPREVFGASAGAAIYRRGMLDDTGFFDEDFFMTHEDSDLSFRVRLMGYRCLYVPSAIAYHRVGATIGRESDAAVYHSQRNSEFVFLKNMPSVLVLRYWPLHLLATLASLISHARRGKIRPYLRGKLDALRMTPGMLVKRREIQRARRVSARQIDGMLSRGWFWSRVRERLPGKTGERESAGHMRVGPDGQG